MNHVAGKSMAACFMLTFLGCGDSGIVQVSGKVSYQNRPLVCGVVTFQPLEDGSVSTRRASIGVIESDGTYRVSTFAPHDGMLPGEYLVAIDGGFEAGESSAQSIDPGGPAHQAAPVGDSTIPTKYLLPQTSGLRATVPADVDKHEINFVLEMD